MQSLAELNEENREKLVDTIRDLVGYLLSGSSEEAEKTIDWRKDQRLIELRQEISTQTKVVHSSKTQPKCSHKEIKKALTYIQKNIHSNITLEEVCNHVYLSTSYFSRLFKKEMGVSFITYLNQEKVKQARELLAQTDLPVKTISHNLGFRQTSYFCKIFKSSVGTTPENFRKNH